MRTYFQLKVKDPFPPSVVAFTQIYERLDVKDLVDRGESFYQDMMGDTVKKLDDKGLRCQSSVIE